MSVHFISLPASSSSSLLLFILISLYFALYRNRRLKKRGRTGAGAWGAKPLRRHVHCREVATIFGYPTFRCFAVMTFEIKLYFLTINYLLNAKNETEFSFLPFSSTPVSWSLLLHSGSKNSQPCVLIFCPSFQSLFVFTYSILATLFSTAQVSFSFV